jgi:hypothetical protein
VTAREIFEQAIAIIDELSDNGTVSDTQTREYRARAPFLLEMWQREMGKVENTEITEKISSLDDTVQITDGNCPSGAYYLAIHFAMADQNTDLADLCRIKYESLKREARKPLEPTNIIDVYQLYPCEDVD